MSGRQANRDEILQAAKRKMYNPYRDDYRNSQIESTEPETIGPSTSNRTNHPDSIDMAQVNRLIGRKPSE